MTRSVVDGVVVDVELVDLLLVYLVLVNMVVICGRSGLIRYIQWKKDVDSCGCRSSSFGIGTCVHLVNAVYALVVVVDVTVSYLVAIHVAEGRVVEVKAVAADVEVVDEVMEGMAVVDGAVVTRGRCRLLLLGPSA